MPIQTQSADGTIHEFPDGTPDSVVDSAMKEHAAQTGPQVGALEAAGHGAEHGLTFGASPVIHGLTEASGLPGLSPYDVNMMGIPLKPLAGAGRMLADWALGHPDPSVRESYERGRQVALKSEQLAQEQHPYAYMGGVLAGSLAMPGFGAARGVTAAGRIGHGMGAGAAGAGLYGLGESLSQERSLPETAKAVGTDVGLGAGLGVAGAGAVETISPMVRQAVNVVRGIRDPEAEASRRVVSNLAEDWRRYGPSMTPEEITAAHAAGTPMSLVDTGAERTRALARSAANTSPEARQALTEMTAERFQDQAPRISSFIQRMTGGGDLAADVQKIEDAARKANAGTYKVAYANGQNGLWSDELARLAGSPSVQSAMKGAVDRGKDRAIKDGMGAFNPGVTFDNGVLKFGQGKGVPPYPDMQFWDYAQRELRDMATAASRQGRNEEAGTLFGLRRQLVDELDRMNPAFANARQGAARFFGADNALEAGAKFVNARDNMKIGEATAAYGKMTQPEQDLFARGFATELAQRIRNSGDSRNVLNSTFLNNDAARARIDMALGPQNARQLEALLRAESVVDRSRTALGNSTTARQLVEMGMAGGAEMLLEQDFNPAHMLTAAFMMGAARRGAQVIDQRVARRVGEMLASNDPAVLARGLQIVGRNPTMFNALRQATASGARIGAEAIEEGGQKRAHGGSVAGQESKPPLRGARKGKDGRWYINDPSRPGKYLRVESRAVGS